MLEFRSQSLIKQQQCYAESFNPDVQLHVLWAGDIVDDISAAGVSQLAALESWRVLEKDDYVSLSLAFNINEPV